MVERRACFADAQPGTQQERIDRAQAKINKSRDRRIKVLDRLCERYLQLKCAGADTRELEARIEGVDTALAHMDRCAALITSILFLSYRAGMNSTSVAEVLGCVKPPLVRQTNYRARKIAEEIFGGGEQQLKCSQDHRAAMSAQKLRRSGRLLKSMRLRRLDKAAEMCGLGEQRQSTQRGWKAIQEGKHELRNK